MPAPASFENKQLLLLISQDDPEAFESLFEKYKSRVYSLCLKMVRVSSVAEELVQDVFLNLWLHRSQLVNVENADAYIFTTTYNIISNHLKKVARHQQLLKDLVRSYKGISGTEQYVDYQQSLKASQRVIGELPEQRRRIFLLNKEEGLSYNQIAAHLQISPHTVRNQLAEAKKQIYQLLLERGFLCTPFLLVWKYFFNG
ncbi:MAG: RNA polymerase sigma factor [Candidatus Dadabacteria bacterium]